MGSIFLGSFPFYGQTAFNQAIPFLEDRSDAACRVVYKNRGSPCCGMVCAWRRQWRHRDRNATRKGIPANADCRGGVFAARRFPRPPPPPCPSHALRFLSRRGTPRRYILRETGESVVNHRIPKGRPRQKVPSPMPIPCPVRLSPMNPTVFIATRRAASLQTPPLTPAAAPSTRRPPAPAGGWRSAPRSHHPPPPGHVGQPPAGHGLRRGALGRAVRRVVAATPLGVQRHHPHVQRIALPVGRDGHGQPPCAG